MAYNKKILSDIINKATKAKSISKPKDIDYNSKMGYRDDSPFRNKSSIDINTPNGTIDMSNTGKPLLANGRYLAPYSGTHQFNTNVVTEQPLQAKRGGLVRMPKPTKKGLASKKYSRSLSATNRLFTENSLFKKPRSKKRKVFDPNAKYYQDGGINKLEGDLISKVLMERNRGTDFVDRAYALGDNPGTPMFNLPDDEQFGQNMSHKMAWGEDDAGQAYMFPTVMNPNDEAIQVPNQYADYISSEGYKNATGMNYQDGGFVIDLSPEQIEEYRRGGYIVEEIPEMQPGGSFKPGKGYKTPTLSKDQVSTIKKEVAKAKPVAAKTPVAKKPSTSSFADRAAQVEKENKLKGIENKAVDEATYIAARDRYNKEQLSAALDGIGEITGINSAIRTGDRIIDDPLQFADDLTTGISQAPETLVEGAMTLGSKLFGDNKDYVDVDTDALGVVADFAGALPVVGTASKVAKPIIKSAKLKEFFNRPPGPLMLGLGSRTKTPKTIPNFESEIDWVNWVKKHNKNYDAEDIQNVIKNSEEYNIIEQQTKANGAWMKNADGSPFQGTPEQFIQTQSTKFKEAYPEGTEVTYRGGDKDDMLKSNWDSKSNVVFTTKDELGARTYNRTLDEPSLSLTEAPSEGISQLYMPKTSNKIVIDGNMYPVGHEYRKHGLSYIDSKGKEVYPSSGRTNYARLNVIDQVPANELEAKNLEAFKNWMLEKHPTMTERGWSGEPRILNDWVMTDYFADFLNSPAGKDVSRVEFQKIMDGTLEPIDVEVHNLNKLQQLKSMWGNSGEFNLTNPNKFKALLPYIIPTGLGAGAATYGTSENNTEPQNYKEGGQMSPKDLDPATLEKYLSDLRGLENSIKKGYKNNKWYPHSSIEGGANTIAYGHKLMPGESFSSGLTEQQAKDLQKKDVLAHQVKAEKYVDDKYGKGSYDKLPQNSQMLLTDYAYNLGSLNKFPSFVEGVFKGDKNKMLQQYERRGLNERNKWTKDIINTTDFSEDSDEGFDWFNPGSWFNKKNGGAIEIDIKNEKDLKEYINKGYIIEEL